MTKPTPLPHPGMGFREFVALIAALMATNALAIDSMLPALPQIGESLGIHDENQRQWIVTAYLLGFGISQLFYGTLSDRFGRKPVLLGGLIGYTLFSIIAALAGNFPVMMAARVLQGIGAGATRVLTISIVRDCYNGRQMARVMSLSFIVFLAVPILAPSLGQVIMLFAPWRVLFGFLGGFGLLVALWTLYRLPETMNPDHKTPISVSRTLGILKTVFTSRIATGYMIAMSLIMGSLFGFINSAQQLFVDGFKAPGLFTTVFALIAAFIAVASFVNARIVGRLGMRRVSHTALLGYLTAAGVHLLVAVAGYESLITFAIFQSLTMFCFGMTLSNFGAMAMEPLGRVAGTAASVQGFVTTTGGALLGFMIGQHFDGTSVPLVGGFVGLGLVALLSVLITEKGRLFTGAGTLAAAE